MKLKEARKKLKALFPKKNRRHELKDRLHQIASINALLTGPEGLAERMKEQKEAWELFSIRSERDGFYIEELARAAQGPYIESSIKLLANYKKLIIQLTIESYQHLSDEAKPMTVVIHLERLKYLRAYKYLIKQCYRHLDDDLPLQSAIDFFEIQSHFLAITQNLIDRSERAPTHERATLLSKFFLKKRRHDIDNIRPNSEIVRELIITSADGLPIYGAPDLPPAYDPETLVTLVQGEEAQEDRLTLEEIQAILHAEEEETLTPEELLFLYQDQEGEVPPPYQEVEALPFAEEAPSFSLV
jgi:hypothetical protein